MKPSIKLIAKQLDGIEYPCRIAKEIIEQAKSINAVIIYGASDDLVEFDGAFQDEIGCYDGCGFGLDVEGRVPDREETEDFKDKELHHWFHRKEREKTVIAYWDQGNGFSWEFATDIPCETFIIMDNSDTYCRGFVISLDELEATR